MSVMKKAAFVITITLLISVCYSQRPDKMTDKDVDNLKLSLAFENEGVRKCAVYLAGFYKVEEAVIPLMRILHEEENPEIRILAARSLSMIGDSRGIYAIYGVSKYDSNPKVRAICCCLYSEFAKVP